MNLDRYQPPQLVQPLKGQPRCNREELTTKFQVRLNEDRKKAGYKPYSYPHVAKMFKGLTETAMTRLYDDCLGADAFGALLKWKLNQINSKEV